jgi:hypothetical protein
MSVGIHIKDKTVSGTEVTVARHSISGNINIPLRNAGVEGGLWSFDGKTGAQVANIIASVWYELPADMDLFYKEFLSKVWMDCKDNPTATIMAI